MDGEGTPIRCVCVAGAGIVGLSAALAFARTLPRARIILAALPPDPAALADRLPSTLPAVGRFHAAIGLDELELVRAGIASHRLATRFERWSAEGEAWHHAFGTNGAPVGDAPFHKAWVKARMAGRAAPFDRHNAAAVLAGSGRFVHPDANPQSPLSTYLYALRLDPERYRNRLASACDAQGIERVEGELAGTERRQDGGLSALVLTGGRRVEADLFLDCAGPSASLLGAVAEERFEDWSQWLPCDRLLLAGNEEGGRTDPSDLAAAHPEGWRWEIPLPNRLLTGFAFASTVTSEAGASELFEGAETVAIRPGRRPQPWTANVLAIGDAASAVDPLEGVNLHLAQSAILRALELLPGRDCHPLELAEYNRRTEWETLRVRDFIALHYLRAGRSGGPFWKALTGRRLPDTLALTLEQWERRGRLPFFEEEAFGQESWASVLLGLGVMPRAVDPAADRVGLDRSAAAIDAYAKRLAALPATMPSYADYLARMRNSRAR
ncbi:MAG TPA: tryptophan halogenase family protein [Allosphingosinicella sp.]|jgi:tryptophan halogenase